MISSQISDVRDFVSIADDVVTIGKSSGDTPLIDAEDLRDILYNLPGGEYEIDIVGPVRICGSARELFAPTITEEILQSSRNYFDMDDLDSMSTFETLNRNNVTFGSINGVENLDTKLVTDMSFMFESYPGTSLDLSHFDTSNVTDMRYMFKNCHNLKDLDLSSFDTSNVETMYGMFVGDFDLHSVDVSSFDTSKVEDMSRMFSYCNVDSLDLSGFDTRSVETMKEMFKTSTFDSLNLSSFDFRNVDSFRNMFDCYFDELKLKDMTVTMLDDGVNYEFDNVLLQAKDGSVVPVDIVCKDAVAETFMDYIVKLDSAELYGKTTDDLRKSSRTDTIFAESCDVSWDDFGKYSAGSREVSFGDVITRYIDASPEPERVLASEGKDISLFDIDDSVDDIVDDRYYDNFS